MLNNEMVKRISYDNYAKQRQARFKNVSDLSLSGKMKENKCHVCSKNYLRSSVKLSISTWTMGWIENICLTEYFAI